MKAQRRAIIWGRFSSSKQEDGDSRERQDRLNRALAKRLGIKVIAEHFDPASSVKEGVTPLFKKVIAELPQGVGIICENLDRINRGHPWKQKAYLYDIIERGHFIITSQDGTEYNEQTINQVGTVATGDLQTNLANAENAKRTARAERKRQRRLNWHGMASPHHWAVGCLPISNTTLRPSNTTFAQSAWTL
jgi:DNA invertase Pin-like site-specific DNA recombinase